jgi:outer membrane protein assembly factor BamE
LLYRLVFIGIFQLFILSGCAVHTIDIQQGNVIDEEALSRISVGMSSQQVRFVMGTPMIVDPFHKGRWDYVYVVEPGDVRKVTEHKHVTLFFENDRLAKINKEIIVKKRAD